MDFFGLPWTTQYIVSFSEKYYPRLEAPSQFLTSEKNSRKFVYIIRKHKTVQKSLQLDELFDKNAKILIRDFEIFWQKFVKVLKTVQKSLQFDELFDKNVKILIHNLEIFWPKFVKVLFTFNERKTPFNLTNYLKKKLSNYRRNVTPTKKVDRGIERKRKNCVLELQKNMCSI